MKHYVIAAALALAPAASGAVTLTQVGMTAGAVTDIFAGYIGTAEIDGNKSDGAGFFSWGFKNVDTGVVLAINTNSLNPNGTVANGGFSGARAFWVTEKTTSTNTNGKPLQGTIIDFLTVSETRNGVQLTTTFDPGETVWLTVSWTDVTADRSNLDVRVSAVPLPAAGWMLVAGIGALGLYARRRETAAA